MKVRPRNLRGVLGMYERTQAELSKLLGSKSRSSELMRGTRYLNKHQIRLLHEQWGIDLGQLFDASFPKEARK